MPLSHSLSSSPLQCLLRRLTLLLFVVLAWVLATPWRHASFDSLEAELTQHQAAVAETQSRVTELDSQLEKTQVRPDQRSDQLAATKARQTERREQLASLPAADSGEAIGQAREDNKLALKQPKPSVFSSHFGDNSASVFVSDRVHRMPLTHDLHVALNKALAENGIEPPLPQQDIHLRSVEADLAPLGTQTAARDSGKPEQNPVQA